MTGEVHFYDKAVPGVETPVMTTYSSYFKCECGGLVEVFGELDEPVVRVTAQGVPCNGCDRTYTVEIEAQGADDSRAPG